MQLTKDNLQLVLINVRIRSVLNTKAPQGSVATGLMCGKICNDQFVR